LILTLWCALILCASGCTSVREYVANGFKVGPNYLRPAAPVAQDWIDADDVRIRDESVDLSAWWHVFRDPVLDSLVARAYEQNLTLREAGFRVLQARALRNIAVGTFFPQQQDAFGGYSRNGVSTATANTSFLPQRFYSQWEGGFNLAWELDFWGRFRRAIEAAEADLDASIENYDDVLVTLVGDVATNYVQARVLQRELVLVRGNVELQMQTLELAEARFRGGQTSELDVDQARSNLAQTEALVPQLEIQLRVVNNQLCVLLGIPPQDLATMLGTAPIPTAPPEVAIGVPAELLTRRPDIRRAERIVAAQSARIGVAMSELYPHISIGGTIGVSSEQIDDLFTSPALFGTVGPGFQWNILNYGRLVNNVRFHDARFQDAILGYQNTVLIAGAEVENGLVQFLRSQQQTRALAISVEASERAVNIAIAQYKGGVVDFNRVALLQQNLVEQQDLLAQAQGDIALGLVNTYKALGGGWQIRLAPPGVVAAEEVTPPPPLNKAPPAPDPDLPLPAPLPGNPPNGAAAWNGGPAQAMAQPVVAAAASGLSGTSAN